jgi:hypothetical protein
MIDDAQARRLFLPEELNSMDPITHELLNRAREL